MRSAVITWTIAGIVLVVVVVGLAVALSQGKLAPKTQVFGFNTSKAPTGTYPDATAFCRSVQGQLPAVVKDRSLFWLLIVASPTKQIHAEMVKLYEHPNASTTAHTEALVNAQLAVACP